MIPLLREPRLYRDDASPFSGIRNEGRPLCFFIELDGIPESEARRLLLEYVRAGTIVSYAAFPIEGAKLIELPRVPADYAPAHPLEDALTVSWQDADRQGWFGVLGVKRQLDIAAAGSAELGISTESAQACVLFAAAADQWRGCDGLVNDDPATRRLAPPRSNVLSSDEALALVGLWSRLRGDFGIGPDMVPLGRWLYYWVLARELLPGGWRWFTACLHSSRSPEGDASLGDLGGAALSRLDSALRARDQFHGEAKRRPARSGADQALFYFETTCLYLSAAFDVAARVANAVYRLGTRARPSWRNDDWLTRLHAREPQLADLMTPVSAGRDALEAVQLLRNTIHGEAIRGVDHQGMGGDRRTLLRVPDGELARLLPVIERLGGHNRWGLDDRRSLLDPQQYIEALLTDAARSLDALLDATDVTRLPGLAGVDLGGPPANVASGEHPFRLKPFSFEVRRRVRLLAGFGEISEQALAEPMSRG